MATDFERPLLYGIAIVAILITIVAVVFVILGITQGNAIANTDCVYACGSLPSISNEKCIKDRYGNCTSFRPYDTTYASFQISDSQISYSEACAGLCDGTVSMGPNGFICSSSECTTGDCPYYTCINQFKPTDQCNSLSNPIACANNTVYYPYQSAPLGTSYTTCTCLLA